MTFPSDLKLNNPAPIAAPNRTAFDRYANVRPRALQFANETVA
jgi:hypothetical protein